MRKTSSILCYQETPLSTVPPSLSLPCARFMIVWLIAIHMSPLWGFREYGCLRFYRHAAPLGLWVGQLQ